MIAIELGVIVARSTHTRMGYYHIIRIEIARDNRAERTRSVLGLWGELSQAVGVIHAITTIVTSTNKLKLAAANGFGLVEHAFRIGCKLMDSHLALFALSALLYDDSMLLEFG